MMYVILIGIGGFIGAVLRYLTSDLVQRIVGGALMPYGTLAVNMIGCLLIGFLAGVAEAHEVFSAEGRALVFVGLLGAFTTFSTFSFETTSLLRDGEIGVALVNVGVQVALGLVAVWLGNHLAARIG
ncbi:MAG: fluoride efflux transporter CrcB [Anaerolineae bacterium]|nr:fluoride efflux transporter CrcB [Anaerolineae bacterium]